MMPNVPRSHPDCHKRLHDHPALEQNNRDIICQIMILILFTNNMFSTCLGDLRLHCKWRLGDVVVWFWMLLNDIVLFSQGFCMGQFCRMPIVWVTEPKEQDIFDHGPHWGSWLVNCPVPDFSEPHLSHMLNVWRCLWPNHAWAFQTNIVK